MNKGLYLSGYMIQHPTRHRSRGAKHVAVPTVTGNTAKKIIEHCIALAKAVALEEGTVYEEMIHYLNGKVVNPDEVLNMLPDEDVPATEEIEPKNEVIKKDNTGYSYQSKTCAY